MTVIPFVYQKSLKSEKRCGHLMIISILGPTPDHGYFSRVRIAVIPTPSCGQIFPGGVACSLLRPQDCLFCSFSRLFVISSARVFSLMVAAVSETWALNIHSSDRRGLLFCSSWLETHILSKSCATRPYIYFQCWRMRISLLLLVWPLG